MAREVSRMAGAQPAPVPGQNPGFGLQPSGSSDTVGRIADKVLRTVQQRAGQQNGQRGGQRGSRGWLGDILR
ncbi:hypothetical protein [Agrococcus sp. ARC_14]|uniref:hypothetical protein n=1 Tax=Agrococcus sp. ARC_14 TaxID=2919927 RepID=UPI001F058890|nr:hypothetical protein [Agrococcus sp. ARC_14]MCH1882495.1 hypothetical protein [Agrococcus sp. ARC_14]